MQSEPISVDPVGEAKDGYDDSSVVLSIYSDRAPRTTWVRGQATVSSRKRMRI